MGIEGFIKNMDPKLKNLFENIMTVIMVLMMAYGAITFILVYMEYNNFMAWFNTSHFATTVVILVFVGIGYKMLMGGKLHFPEQEKGKKMEFNIPDTYGVRKIRSGEQQTKLNIPNPLGVKNQQQRMNIPNPMGQKPQQQFNPQQQWKQTNQPLRGSWKCPNCGSVVVGDVCLKCGYRRQ